MVKVSNKAFPTWWRGVPYPPPASWKYTFELFTGDDTADEWGLAAAIFIAQYRRRHSYGPTFRELFEHLLQDTGGVPARLPREWDLLERRHANGGFRGHVTLDWRRRGYIGFDKQVTRSLRVGPRFRERSRQLQKARKVEHESSSNEQATFLIASSAATGSVPSTSLAHEVPNDLPGMEESDRQEALKASLNTDEVIARLHVTNSYLKRLREAHYLHAIDHDGDVRYPGWQFSSQPNRPVVPGIDIIVAAIPRDWALASIHAFMRTPQDVLELDGDRQTPVQWLIRGGDPATVAEILEEISAQ